MSNKRPKYKVLNGYHLPVTFSEESFLSAEEYKPEEGEVIIVTYPKSGTTWTLQIILLILRGGTPPTSVEEYFASLPFLEMDGQRGVQQMSRPGCIKTHLPFNRVNFTPEVKYIYVARHPADCIVSFFNHVKFFPTYEFSDGVFDDFFDAFLEGQVAFNDYFDNLLSWYDRRDEPNVFFATYEQLKADTAGMVLKMARFLGEDYHGLLLENEGEILKDVLRYSSLEYMRSTVNEYWKLYILKDYEKMESAAKSGNRSVGDFVRNGEVGEGKIFLSKDQIKRLNARMCEKNAQMVVKDLWPGR